MADAPPDVCGPAALPSMAANSTMRNAHKAVLNEATT